MKHTHNDVYAMRGIYEADIIYILPTAKAVGYLSAAFIRLYDNMLT